MPSPPVEPFDGTESTVRSSMAPREAFRSEGTPSPESGASGGITDSSLSEEERAEGLFNAHSSVC